MKEIKTFQGKEPLAVILEVIDKHIDRKNIQTFIFGSRAKGDFKKNSDYDIGVLGKEKLNRRTLGRLRSDLEEIPYRVDVIDFNSVDPKFKELAMKYTIPL